MSSPHPSAEARLEAALGTLRARGQRITEPRKAILRVLIREHGPFTTEELYGHLPKGLCDLVTVYRCLSAMEEINLVRRCDFGDGSQRYEYDAGDHHHHHLVCRACRDVQTLDLCVADSLERIARQMGYANVNHTLEIFGLCPKCQAASTHSAARKPGAKTLSAAVKSAAAGTEPAKTRTRLAATRSAKRR